jgi:hypothetical protein
MGPSASFGCCKYQRNKQLKPHDLTSLGNPSNFSSSSRTV